MENNYGMKWHKFLIHFSLWVGGIVDIVFGAAMLLIMMTDTPWRYQGKTGLLTLMVLLAVLILASGIYCIVVRFRLAGFRRNAPAQLFILLIVVNLSMALFLMIDEGLAITSAIPGIAMAFVNRYYYSKRAELFVK